MSKKNKLIEHVLTSCENEYKEKIALFNQLDSKAQQTIGFSGLLLGFLISFLREEIFCYIRSAGLFGIYSYCSLIFILICAIIICIYSMKITKTKDLPTYELTKSEFNDLILKDETNLSVDNINNYLVSKIKLWEVSLISVDEVNKSKAKLIYISQVFIGLCLFVLGLVTIVIALYY